MLSKSLMFSGKVLSSRLAWTCSVFFPAISGHDESMVGDLKFE